MLTIDENKCIKCTACIKECPAEVFEMGEKSAIVQIAEACINCGHCVAICPANAVSHAGMEKEDFLPIENPNITYDQFYHLTRNRRSTRRYKATPVSDENIEQLLQSVRYCPTGENAQELEYLVISQPERLKLIREAMAKKFRLGKALLNNGLIRIFVNLAVGKEEANRLRYSLNRIMQRYTDGEDPFLRGAPTLIVIHCRQKTAMAPLDAGIAGHQLTLTAEVLGLGTCWIGFLSAMAQIFKSVRKTIPIPKKQKVLACIVVGHPQFKYKKTCARNPLQIEKFN